MQQRAVHLELRLYQSTSMELASEDDMEGEGVGLMELQMCGELRGCRGRGFRQRGFRFAVWKGFASDFSPSNIMIDEVVISS